MVETPERHTIVLTSRRMAPMSLEQVISLGIRPESKDILIVKGVVGAAAPPMEPVAGEGGVGRHAWRDERRSAALHVAARRRRPLFPLEPAQRWYGECLPVTDRRRGGQAAHAAGLLRQVRKTTSGGRASSMSRSGGAADTRSSARCRPVQVWYRNRSAGRVIGEVS